MTPISKSGRPPKLKPPVANKFKNFFHPQLAPDEIIDLTAPIAVPVSSVTVDPLLPSCSGRPEFASIDRTRETNFVHIAFTPIVSIEPLENALMLVPARNKTRRDRGARTPPACRFGCNRWQTTQKNTKELGPRHCRTFRLNNIF